MAYRILRDLVALAVFMFVINNHYSNDIWVVRFLILLAAPFGQLIVLTNNLWNEKIRKEKKKKSCISCSLIVFYHMACRWPITKWCQAISWDRADCKVWHFCSPFPWPSWVPTNASRLWYINSLRPSHYLNQCWNIFNWAPRNTLQWDFNWNS